MEMSLDNYESNLEHMAEPASPKERRDANSIEVDDFIALYLSEIVDEYGHYEVQGTEKEGIAKGYGEYLRDRVRNASGRHNTVRLYFHTSTAAQVVLDALDHFPESGRCDIYPHIIDQQYEYLVQSALDWGYSIRLGDDIESAIERFEQ